ncbi:prephenate dehydrogenase/arogenate dehydrogenase family protein [Halodesulfurarchaeum sp.]|uniref:prephenate dehydrogenase/arogenate dehydrogenase family protein n=1 Tax=Halodesulfurarchaeum sp. TaxID=1980530 RepID=UPI002FC36B4C
MDALIVGSGAVGRWVGARFDGSVSFADADRETAESAAAEVAGGSVADLEGTEAYDVVAIAVPIRVTPTVIRAQASRAEGAIVDFTGSMTEPLAVMEETASAVERVSFHPLFAPEHAPGRIAKSVGKGGPIVDEITRSFVEAGNTVVPVEPAVHDDAMGTVQGRVHAAVLAFGLAADPVPEKLGTPVYEELQALRERVTSGEPGVYADIQETFDGIEALQEAIDQLAQADRAEFEALYDDAG